MKVGNINPVLFKNTTTIAKQDKKQSNISQTTELSTVTPDFGVQTPQKYTFLGVQKCGNGLNIHSYKLANGQRVTIIPMENSPTVVKNYVNVGSINETDNIKGISHFLEHMAFNGTNGSDGYIKLNQGDAFKKIDALGGWTNASTNYALTDYVNSTQVLEKQDLEEQLKIIAAMSEDLTLSKEMVEKEKGPVCSEINMILDNPETILMDQTVRSLFNIKSSADELVGGSVRHIQNLTDKDVKDYYNKYYTPDNMNLVITGDVNPQETIELVSKLFKSRKKTQGKTFETPINPINKTARKDFITDKATSANIMLGFAGPKNNDIKSKILFEITDKYLFSPKNNLTKDLKRLNASSPDFGMEKISTNPNNPTLMYYTFTTSEENAEKAVKVVFDSISGLKAPDKKTLENIKEKLLQEYTNGLEYSVNVNSIAGSSLFNGSLDYLTDYENIINEITTEDVNQFISENLNLKKSALTIVHPQNKTSPSFKRRPVNPDKISVQKLNNNYQFAAEETKNQNTYFDINLYYNLPDTKPAVREVLAQIYKQNLEYIDYLQFAEDNSLRMYTGLNEENLKISANSGAKNFEKAAIAARKLLETPKITQKEVSEAIKRIKDNLSRTQETAAGIYIDNEAKTNPLYTSKQDILENIDSVSVKEVSQLHKAILNNSYGTISMNIPSGNSEIKTLAEKEFAKLNNVQNPNYSLQDVFIPNKTPLVLTKPRAQSQADIMETYKFKLENTPKEHVMGEILNTILTSSSIGLFNTLREKEHLAYTVFSDISQIGNCGEMSLNILTTTDNKDIGEISYDNVQKSINGFNRQINELLNSKYTDDDLESAKRILKAKLLQKEGVPAKLDTLNRALESGYKMDYDNKLFEEIDKITRADIDNFAKRVFAGAPIYAIATTKDTLDNNKNYFQSLKQPTFKGKAEKAMKALETWEAKNAKFNEIINKMVNQQKVDLRFEQLFKEKSIDADTRLEISFKNLSQKDTNPQILEIKKIIKDELGIEKLFFDNDLEFANNCLKAMRLIKKYNLELPKQIIASRHMPEGMACCIEGKNGMTILSSNITEADWAACVDHPLHKFIHEGIHANQNGFLVARTKKLSPDFRKIADNVSCYASENYVHEVHAELFTKKILAKDAGVEFTPDEERLLEYLNELFLINTKSF